MNYFENFNEPIPAPPALPLGWTSTSILPANPWNRVLVSGLTDYAASALATEGSTLSTLNSPSIPIGPLGGTLTFDNLFNLEDIVPFVSALAIQDDGKILVGGSFSKINGFSRQSLVRLNSDGTVDPTFQVDIDGSIRIITIDSSNQMIYVGGFFTTINNQPIRGMARISPTGILDISFVPQAQGVREIIITTPGPAGTIYIGGNFNTVNAQLRRRVAKLNYDGTIDPAFDSTANFTSSNRVMALSFDSLNGLLIGGAFQLTNGRFNIARLDPMTGALDNSFLATTDNTFDAVVNDIALDISGSGIFITGGFSTINTVNRNIMAKLNRNDGSLDPAFNPTPSLSGPFPLSAGSVIYLNEIQNQLLIVGEITVPRTGIVGLDRLTGQVATNPNIIIDGVPVEIAPIPLSNTDFIIGGSFTNIGGITPSIPLLAKINVLTNSVDPSFKLTFTPFAFDGMVLEIKIGAGPFEDIIVAGGSFIQGGYNADIVPSALNPLAGRSVWSGLSAGTLVNPEFITTRINLPIQTSNQLIELRWILGCDDAIIPIGLAGAQIDNISIIMNRFICILPGAMVLTDRGKLPIEELKVDDFVFDENNNKIRVLQNFKIPMIKSTKTICIKKNAFGISKPDNLLRITHGHPIKIRGEDSEQLVESFLNNKNVKNLKLKTDYVYNIVTKERVFVNINNIFVATWNQEELYKHMSLSNFAQIQKF